MSSSSADNRLPPSPTKRRRIIVENDDEEMENEILENLNPNQRNVADREEVERVNEEIVEDASDVDSNPDVYNGNILHLFSLSIRG